jgi:phosphatidylserine decarboxylase
MTVAIRRLTSAVILLFVASLSVGPASLAGAPVTDIAGSPCERSLGRLRTLSVEDEALRATFDQARRSMVPAPHWAKSPNPWLGIQSVDELVERMVAFGRDWCVALPKIQGSSDDGLAYINDMYWFFYRNPAAVALANGRDLYDMPLKSGFDFFKELSIDVGAFLDTSESTGTITQWVDNPRIEIGDYVKQDPAEYKSWNDFFVRELITDPQTGEIPSRPIARPESDYVVSSPADCIVNPIVQIIEKNGQAARRWIESPLQLNEVVDVKGVPIDVRRLFGDAPDELVEQFQGGTGLSCVLMPANYHHFHAPVSGTVVWSQIVKGPTFGYDDWPNFLPFNHNAAQPGMDFSRLEVYQRGVVITKVTYAGADGSPQTGYVALVPVGLDTVGSVRLESSIVAGASVTRGLTRIGHFAYGGSINLILFSRGLGDGVVQVRMGSQIGVLTAK